MATIWIIFPPDTMEFFVEHWQNIKVSSPGGISRTVTEIDYDTCNTAGTINSCLNI